MFVGRAYRDGFDQGGGDGRSGRDKRPRPRLLKLFLGGGKYIREFYRGYHAGYAQGCRTEGYARQRQEQTASREERRAALGRGRSRDRSEELERD